MLRKSLVIIIGFIFASSALAREAGKGRWLDLTHAFNESSIYWPTAKMFTKEEVFHGHTAGGWFYTAYNFSAAEHGGTHMDAPIHFAEGKETTDRVPLDRLIGPGVVIDVEGQAAADVDYLVTAQDVLDFEVQHGRIAAGSIVLINTGRAKFYGDRKTYMGTDERGEAAVAKLHFPGLGLDGAALLVERGVAAVGIDTPSIDFGQSKDFAVHVKLMTNSIPAFENVADMSKLPATGSLIVALPMKIEGGSGGPVRIVARLPDP